MWPLLLTLVVIPQDIPEHPTIPVDPMAAGGSSTYRSLFSRGIEEAESFRSELLETADGGVSYAYRLGEAIERFRSRARRELRGRPGVAGFVVSPREFEARVRGVGAEAGTLARSFSPFAGRWHGLWGSSRVDHEWSEVASHDPPRRVAGLDVRATQSAWIGDGFGWNVVVVPGSRGAVILGSVYHVEPGRPGRIRLHRPHVGVDAGPGRLIWVTAREVFLEERIPGDGAAGDRYAITGFRYERRGETIGFTGAGFQAVYTRDPDERPEWHEFAVRDRDDPSPTPRTGAAR